MRIISKNLRIGFGSKVKIGLTESTVISKLAESGENAATEIGIQGFPLRFIQESKVVHTFGIFGIVGIFCEFSSECHRILFLGKLLGIFSISNSGLMIFQS